jgi:transcriptional regulator
VYAVDARGALAGMGARERAVLVADACGEAREVIAKAWGTSRANVDQIVSRGRRRVGDA